MNFVPLSDPTLFNDVKFDDKVFVVQKYGPKVVNNSIEHYFKGIEGKIILLYLNDEYFFYSVLEKLINKSKNFYKKNGKLQNYYIILSRHPIDKSIEDNKDYLLLINDYRLYGHFTDVFEKISYKKNLKYHFLSLNNRAMWSRQAAFYFFNKFNLLEKSYFSYRGTLGTTNYNSYEGLSEILSGKNPPWYMKNLDIDRLNKLIPYVIPGDQFLKNDWTYGQKKFYNETFCSLIFETYDNQEYPYLTEKTFKPIAFWHPFIIYSNPNSLKILQSLGFQTFSNFWDESYDELDGNARLESIFHTVLEIAGWPHKKLIDLQTKIYPILEHNHKHFFDVLPRMYQDFKKEVIKNVNQLCKEKI